MFVPKMINFALGKYRLYGHHSVTSGNALTSIDKHKDQTWVRGIGRDGAIVNNGTG